VPPRADDQEIELGRPLGEYVDRVASHDGAGDRDAFGNTSGRVLDEFLELLGAMLRGAREGRHEIPARVAVPVARDAQDLKCGRLLGSEPASRLKRGARFVGAVVADSDEAQRALSLPGVSRRGERHGARGAVHEAQGHAAREDLSQPAAVARAQDDQVRPQLSRDQLEAVRLRVGDDRPGVGPDPLGCPDELRLERSPAFFDQAVGLPRRPIPQECVGGQNVDEREGVRPARCQCLRKRQRVHRRVVPVVADHHTIEGWFAAHDRKATGAFRPGAAGARAASRRR